jgi:hypothetical protein
VAEAVDRSATVRDYEVRVQGRLSRAVLGYLAWSSRTEPGHCYIRVLADSTNLASLLRGCLADGLVVDRITRLDRDRADRASKPARGIS